jgi:hypothetical protein
VRELWRQTGLPIANALSISRRLAITGASTACFLDRLAQILGGNSTVTRKFPAGMGCLLRARSEELRVVERTSLRVVACWLRVTAHCDRYSLYESRELRNVLPSDNMSEVMPRCLKYIALIKSG